MRKQKVAIAKPRRVTPDKPEIYVRVQDGWKSNYAHASIRVKAGQYNYLVWRDGDQIRNFYLGKKKILDLHTSPGRESSRSRRRAAAAPISVGQKRRAKVPAR